MSHHRHPTDVTRNLDAGPQRGAALIIVLVLVASLSFIAMGLTDQTKRTAKRTINDQTRASSLWRALGAENLAATALEGILLRGDEVMSIDDDWAAAPIPLPMDDGAATVHLIDASRCFNLNAFAKEEDEDDDDSALKEFERLLDHLGLGAFEGARLGEVIIDWIDANDTRENQGAEDDYYTSLPVPYRTGGTMLADVSELRAMEGVSAALYRQLKPYICALPNSAPSVLNINMLRTRDAPILAALLGDEFTLGQASDAINARPPGGFDSLDAFLKLPVFEEAEFEDHVRGRLSLKSNIIAARTEIYIDTSFLEMTSIFDISNAEQARLMSRYIGVRE